jgi:hypothetical protein
MNNGLMAAPLGVPAAPQRKRLDRVMNSTIASWIGASALVEGDRFSL